ncbi:YfhO family protein [Candidatus Woesearchaeota archaeon]|nr:YfhO family protein [Candidatus Woesearchaeota archaeon]
MNLLTALDNKKVAFAIFFLLSVLFLLPILSNIGNWGGYDWDQHFFYHGSARNAIAKFGQFPLWNPFYCGGSPLLANPQSTFLSPFFLFVLVFGTVAGLKLEALVYLVLGLFGMFLLARKLGAKILPSYFAAAVFMLSSWYSARVVVGHTTFFPFALMPWAVLFYLHAREKAGFALLSAATLAVMLLSGAVYPLYFTAMFIGIYALFDSVQQQKLKPIIIVAGIFALAALFSAVKLLPMLEFTSGLENPTTQYNSFGYTLKGLLSRNQDISQNDAQTGRALISDPDKLTEATLTGKVAWGWHEYSAYIGIIPLLLALIAAISYRKNWKLLVLAAFFLALSLGEFSPLPIWNILRQLPIAGALHGPSRLLIMFAFCSALLGAKALSDIKPVNNRYVVAGLLALVLIDLALVSMPGLGSAFQAEPLDISTNEYTDYVQMLSLSKYQSQYPNMLQNIGTVNCYERVHPRIRALPQFFDTGEPYAPFIGNAYIAETNQTFNISSFTPNKVSIELSPSANGTLVYNQNYMPGWKAKVDGRDGRQQEAAPYNGLVATEVTPSDDKVEFSYSPKSFYIGLVISLVSVMAVAAVLILYRHKLFIA